MNIDFNKIYMSNNYGPFKIIKITDKDKTHHQKVIIEFINTGYIKEVLMSNIHKGNVKDDTILPYNNIDHFNQYQREQFVNLKIKEIWYDMIARCTKPHHKEFYAYGELGIAISDTWMNFDIFNYDIRQLFQFDKFYNNPYNYQLDKDYLQLAIPKYQRIYSKDTCIFLSNRDNTNLRIIENKLLNINSSKYYGVALIKDKYYMGIHCNNYKISIYFNNEIAAANAWNYWFEKFHLYEIVKVINDVPYMPVEEWIKYIISKREMCKIIK